MIHLYFTQRRKYSCTTPLTGREFQMNWRDNKVYRVRSVVMAKMTRISNLKASARMSGTPLLLSRGLKLPSQVLNGKEVASLILTLRYLIYRTISLTNDSFGSTPEVARLNLKVGFPNCRCSIKKQPELLESAHWFYPKKMASNGVAIVIYSCCFSLLVNPANPSRSNFSLYRLYG